MTHPKDLTKKELVSLVEQIRDRLYRDTCDGRDTCEGKEFLNPEKEWDVGTIDDVAGILDNFDLVPKEEVDLPVKKK